MKIKNILLGILSVLAFNSYAQTETNSETFVQADKSTKNKKYSITLGLGYYIPVLSDKNISFPNAQYNPEINSGISYFISLDYALTKDFYVGVGYNSSYAKAKFIENAIVNNQQVDGYLEAGALENSSFLFNITYSPNKKGFKPYAKLGIGYFLTEVELGDVPLSLTDNVEKELFPDYKSSGLGIMPELGVKYNLFTLSVAYGLPFNKLSGESSEVDTYESTGTMRSNSLLINVSYRILLF